MDVQKRQRGLGLWPRDAPRMGGDSLDSREGWQGKDGRRGGGTVGRRTLRTIDRAGEEMGESNPALRLRLGSTGGRTRTRTRTHSHSDQPCSTTEADQDPACVTACDTLPAFRVRLRLACVGLLSAPSTASLDASIRSPQIKVLQPIQPWPSSSAPHSLPRSRRVWPRTTSRPRSSALVSPMT